jgi:acyl-coenzyme A thioesterase PaaI-like protein
MPMPDHETCEPTEERQLCMARLRRQMHQHCVVCGSSNGLGLQLDFVAQPDGSVAALLGCPGFLEGYPDTLHGGVIAAMLDGAMTNCLFAHGRVAVTGELSIRFRRPVLTNHPATVRAWIKESFLGLYVVAAELRQENEVMARATGKFMEQHPAALGADTEGGPDRGRAADMGFDLRRRRV